MDLSIGRLLRFANLLDITEELSILYICEGGSTLSFLHFERCQGLLRLIPPHISREYAVFILIISSNAFFYISSSYAAHYCVLINLGFTINYLYNLSRRNQNNA